MGKIKILVVDDENELCLLIKSGLSHLSGSYDITTANSGNQALGCLKKEHYDVLVTDIRMPDINGLELLNQSKNIQADLQSIVITGHGDLDNAIKALQMGVINYIKKPISLEVLHYSIQKGIEKRELTNRLKKSEEKYRILAEAIIDMIIMYDVSGNIIYVNSAGLRALGYTPKNLIKMNIIELVPPAFHDYFKNRLDESNPVSDENIFQELDLIHKKGTLIPVEIGTSIIRDDNSVNAVLIVARDVSERRMAEEEIRSTNLQLRNLSAHLQSVREEERTTIAREVHDELGQALTAMKMEISWIGKQLTEKQDKLQERTTSMTSLIDSTIQTVKRICSELRPTLLDDLGLAAAIEWQAEEFQRRTGVDCFVTIIPDELQLDSNLSITIYRIVQEALTNVARHSKAKKVTIKLHLLIDELTLIISDDGIGMKTEKLEKPNSFGLIGIRERVLSWGGDVSFSNNNGAVVKVVIPGGK